jgi:hypothetical protein
MELAGEVRNADIAQANVKVPAPRHGRPAANQKTLAGKASGHWLRF